MWANRVRLCMRLCVYVGLYRVWGMWANIVCGYGSLCVQGLSCEGRVEECVTQSITQALTQAAMQEQVTPQKHRE